MAGPTISSINPSTTLQGVSSGSAAGSSTSVPPGILALPSGTLLRGEITQVQRSGTLILSTPKGDIALKSDLPVRVGNEVVLRLDTVSSGLKARVISVDGLTPRELTAARQTTTTTQRNDIVDTATTPANKSTEGTAAKTSSLRAPYVDIKLPQPVILQAVLLSRSSELPQLLQQLPSSIAVPPQRLEAGASFTLKLLPESIQLPTTTTAAATNVQTALPLSAAAASIQAPLTSNTPTTSIASPLSSFPTVMTPEQLNVAATLASPPTALAAATGTTATSIPAGNAPATSTSHNAQGTPPTTGAPPLTLGTTAQNTAQTTTQAATTSATTPTSTQNLSPSAFTTTAPEFATAAVQAPTSPALSTASTALLSQGLLVAEVIGTERSGETVLKTSMGILKTQLLQIGGPQQQLPVGTQLTLHIEMLQPFSPSTDTTAITQGRAPASLLELSQQWDSLKEVAALLAQSNPALAQQIMSQAITQPGPQMATSTLFFLSALRGGDIKQWLGKQAINTIEQMNRGDLLQKMSSEFSTIRQFFMESPSPNWQAVFFPIMEGGELQQAHLFLKKQPQENEAEEGGGTRFIMEIELSHYGSLQLDGLIRKHKPQHSTLFDLILRTHSPLPDADKNAIRNIFIEASELTGFKGSVNFQTNHPFPVLPLEEMIQHDRFVLP